MIGHEKEKIDRCLAPGPLSRTSSNGEVRVQEISTALEGDSRYGLSRTEAAKLAQHILEAALQINLTATIEKVFYLGSSSRGTGMQGHNAHAPSDLDVGLRLAPQIDLDMDQLFLQLQNEAHRLIVPLLDNPLDWAAQLRRHGVCVTRWVGSKSRVDFLDIDVIPFRRVGCQEDEHPQLEIWHREKRVWLHTNPPLFTQTLASQASMYPLAKKIVLLLKHWNHTQEREGGKPPLKNMHIEALMLSYPWDSLVARLSASSTPLSLALAEAFQHLALHVLDADVAPPGGSVHVGPSYIPEDRRNLIREMLCKAADMAFDALNCDDTGDCDASVEFWDDLLCSSWFFPYTSGCVEPMWEESVRHQLRNLGVPARIARNAVKLSEGSLESAVKHCLSSSAEQWSQQVMLASAAKFVEDFRQAGKMGDSESDEEWNVLEWKTFSQTPFDQHVMSEGLIVAAMTSLRLSKEAAAGQPQEARIAARPVIVETKDRNGRVVKTRNVHVKSANRVPES
eukprot:TRINITY_DN23876_c0_g1_i1.p1 TRINITY_DN23876_c0_g1~~TRINITY_DN23876_c0_g1_i1.p1  ORF type:complete len:509 (-),score=74.01 TRINITY_DN23876_c0_g1_i1:132-1658(-)